MKSSKIQTFLHTGVIWELVGCHFETLTRNVVLDDLLLDISLPDS